MKPPIIIVCTKSLDIHAYESSEAMDGGLEAIDVGNNEYRAYDADGQILELVVKIEHSKILRIIPNGTEHISVKETGKMKPKAVKKRIIEYIKSETIIDKAKKDLEKMSLKSLVGLIM